MISIGHLDLNVVLHCNNRCVACSHASPFSKKWFMDIKTIRDDLTTLKPILRCKSVNVVGGEPLLHPSLPEVLDAIKEVGLDESTCVITNGRLLPKMTDEFWSRISDLVISKYANLDPACIELAESKSREFHFVFGVREFTEFYSQFEDNDGSNFHNCPWKTDCYTVHCGRFYLCPQSCFFPERFMGAAESPDGLSLDGITEDSLLAFMRRTEPLATCRICGAYKVRKPWRQAKTEEEWRTESRV